MRAQWIGIRQSREDIGFVIALKLNAKLIRLFS
jgi:hypothetical protein